MALDPSASGGDFNAWNPGLQSDIPSALLPKVTLYAPENADTTYRAAKDAADLCGRKPHEMAALKPSRLALHEIAIRVTADLHVQDGPNYEDLGISMRGMIDRILTGYVCPELPAIERDFSQLRKEIEGHLHTILDRDIFARSTPASPPEPGFLSRLFSKSVPPPAEQPLPELQAVQDWQAAIAVPDTSLDHACLCGLHTIVSGIVGRRGRLIADKDLIVRLAAIWVCNTYGSRWIGDKIAPLIETAAKAEGYTFLPHQAKPFVLNVKGASAAGKSSIRSWQRELAERLGVAWQDFALVSPDYWRKYLLDYDSLGENYKYAAMLTGQELEIIDKKLDRYMEAKAERGQMPHLLIDRFRFDSFAATASQQADSRLLSRFGDTVFMFFIITPPAETVERAWKRGQATGRYKAVDDLLDHNIEAYTGMPQLFFNWVKKDRQKIHFEFLDNSVPLGTRPRTVAFGWNDKITVLDPECMRLLNHYRQVNVAATCPQEVLLEATGAADDFLVDCVNRIADVTFLDPQTLKVLGHTRNGVVDYEAEGFFAKYALSADPASNPDALKPTIDIAVEQGFTVGSWPAC